MKLPTLASWSLLAALAFAMVAIPTSSASPAVIVADEVVPASPDRHAFFRVGPNSVLALVGGFESVDTGCSRVSRATSDSSAVLVLQGDAIIRYEMTASGEVVEGATWFAIRAGVCRGAGSQYPWHPENAAMAAAPVVTLCTPATHDFPRAHLGSIAYDGKCWETTGSGSCGTTKTCGTSSDSFCEVSWTYSVGGGDSETGECGGGIAVEFYCDGNQVPRVRVCN